MPLIKNEDYHFVATVSSILLSILEGKIDCPTSGVFGAGKTRAAAAAVAELLVMDPTLKVMVVTKEDVAAQASAEHFRKLDLPESVQMVAGRLVGYMELQKVSTILLRLCSTVRHPSSPAEMSKRSRIQSTMAPTSVAACR